MVVRIAVDLDEVLGGFLDALVMFHNDRYGSNLTRSDFDSYTFRDVWGGTEEESTVKVNLFFKSSYFTEILAVKGAVEGVNRLKSLGFELAVVTSRQLFIEEETRAWVNRFFPGAFCEILFGNTWGQEGQKRTKPDLCRQTGASMMIDDSLYYASQCAQEGFPTLLFDLDGSYRWNQTDQPLPPLVRRVCSWQQVLDEICTRFC